MISFSTVQTTVYCTCAIINHSWIPASTAKDGATMLKNAQARILLEGRLKYSDYGISKFDCHPWNFSTWNTLMVHGGNSWGFYSLESLISRDVNTYYTWVKYKVF